MAVAMLVLPGCKGTTNSGTTPPVDQATEAQKIARIAGLIEMGANTATAIGLVAIPKEDEANQVATQIVQALDGQPGGAGGILPLLAGDEQVLINNLSYVLSLNFMDNNPILVKAKLLITSFLPLLQSQLPPNLLDQQLVKIPADIKAYMTAFFTGVRNGAAGYLGMASRSNKKDALNKWQQLRMDLEK